MSGQVDGDEVTGRVGCVQHQTGVGRRGQQRSLERIHHLWQIDSDRPRRIRSDVEGRVDGHPWNLRLPSHRIGRHDAYQLTDEHISLGLVSEGRTMVFDTRRIRVEGLIEIVVRQRVHEEMLRQQVLWPLDPDKTRILDRFTYDDVADHRHLVSPPMQPHRYSINQTSVAAKHRDRHGQHPHQVSSYDLVARM